MPKTPRQTSYLQRRGRIWYFRFKLPTEVQSVAERTEIRVSLDTCELSAARERVAVLIPYIHAFKRLAKQMRELTSKQVQKALDLYFSNIVEELAKQSTLVAAQCTRRPLSRHVVRPLCSGKTMRRAQIWRPTISLSLTARLMRTQKASERFAWTC